MPSLKPSPIPSDEPSLLSSLDPSVNPTSIPSVKPSTEPSVSLQPSVHPSLDPSEFPSAAPSECFLRNVTVNEDSFIRADASDDNYGKATSIILKNHENFIIHVYEEVCFGLLWFDTSDFWSRYGNRGHRIVRAYVKCHVNFINANADPYYTATVSRMGPNTWNETGVSWNNLLSTGQDVDKLGPSVNNTNPTPVVSSTDVDYVTFDITDLIDGDDLILVLNAASPISKEGTFGFSSREGLYPPEIYFEEPNAPCLSSFPSSKPSDIPSSNPSVVPSFVLSILTSSIRVCLHPSPV